MVHIFEQHLLTAAVIELCRPTVGVASDPLRSFKSPVIFQKICDTGRPEGVGRIVRR